MNRVIAIQKDNGLIAAYSHDLRGNRCLQKYPAANLETSYGYNLAGLMTELYNKKNGKVVLQFKYTYDIDGNQLTKLNGELETAYEYDKLGRLIAEREVNGNTYLYEYDAFSNRSKLTVSGYDNYATTYEYDINNRLLAETRVEKDFTEKSAYTYDKNGNQIRRSTETIEGKKPWSPPERHLFITAPKEKSRAKIDIRKYDGFGQLVEVYRDGQRISFRYRPDSLRHSKEVTYPFKPSLNRSTTHFWDGQNIVLELNGNGAIKAKYLRGAQLIAQVIGEELFYYLHNAHGDVIQRIAENGTSAPQYKYDAFGNQMAPSYAPRSLSAFSKLRFNQLCFSFGAGELDPNPFRYCGEYFDSETGELYLRARYYDSSTGRFSQEDVAKDGRNWYNYCAHCPLIFVDPSGKSTEFWFALKYPLIAWEIGKVVENKGVTNISTNSVRFSTNDLGLENPQEMEGEGTQVNAYRHAIWAATIANRYGADIALEAAASHEDLATLIQANGIMKLDESEIADISFSTLNEADGICDMLNNDIGISVGIAFEKDTSMKEIAIAALEEYHNEGLWIAVENGDGTYSIQKEVLSDEQYETALAQLKMLDENGFTQAQLENLNRK